MISKTNYYHLVAMLQVLSGLVNDIGGVLKTIKEGELWKTEIGDGVQTWHQFLSQPEINLTVNEANQYIKIFELPLSQDQKKLISLRNLKFIANKPIDPELIADATVLSRTDLRERHHDVSSGSEKRTFEYVLMRRVKETGSLSKVNGVESQELEQKFKDRIENNYGA